MMMRIFLVCLCLLSVVACASTQAVHGAFADNGEKISGQISSPRDAIKRITLTMADRTICQGVYQYDALSSTSGYGHVACDQKPPFDFTFITEQNQITASGIDGTGRAFLFYFKP
jgi:hypothetical protein